MNEYVAPPSGIKTHTPKVPLVLKWFVTQHTAHTCAQILYYYVQTHFYTPFCAVVIKIYAFCPCY